MLPSSGSCNELTFIHTSVTHSHLSLFKNFPRAATKSLVYHLSLSGRVCVAFYLQVDLCFRSHVDFSVYFSVLTGEITAGCHRASSKPFSSFKKKTKKHAVGILDEKKAGGLVEGKN